MIKVKTTVLPKNLVIMAACSNVAEIMGIEILVTSGNDSKHMTDSAHYFFNALDVRSKSPFKSFDQKKEFLDLVLSRLGKKYQGFIEHLGKTMEHFHFEFDEET